MVDDDFNSLEFFTLSLALDFQMNQFFHDLIINLGGAFDTDEDNSNQSDVVDDTAAENSFRQNSINNDANSCEISKVVDCFISS